MSSRAAAIARLLEAWFVSSQRDLPWRRTYEPWHVWVSETMLQQTRMAVVLPYFERFVERFPTVASLAASDEEEVLALWSGLGYYRRARYLHAAAKRIVAGHQGSLPPSFEALLALPGVGRYTAGAVASIAFNEPVPAVDGNVERIVSRLETISAASGTARFRTEVGELASQLVLSSDEPRTLNQALMEVGALICTPTRPRCQECPVREHCRAFAEQTQEEYPRRDPARLKRSMRIPLLVIRDPAGRVLLLRGQGTLLAGMYHLPHGAPDLDPGLHLPASGLSPAQHVFRHSITNRSIEFAVHELDLSDVIDAIGESAEALWVDPRELSHVPHPSYVRKALRQARR